MPSIAPQFRRTLIALMATGILVATGRPPDVAVAQDSADEVICSPTWIAQLRPSWRVPTLPEVAGGQRSAERLTLGGRLGMPSAHSDADRDAMPGGFPPWIGVPDVAPSRWHGGDMPSDATAPEDEEPVGTDAQDAAAVSTRPNDPYFTTSQTVNLRAILSAHEAWETTFGGDHIVIAVVGDGIDIQHPDLASKIWINEDEIPNNGRDDDANGYVDDVRGWDFGTFDNDPMPVAVGDPSERVMSSRGTMMAGIAAAATNNGYGIAGVSWGARIMPVKAMFAWPYRNRDGSITYRSASYTRNLIEGVCYGANQGVDVILLGGMTIRDPLVEEERYESVLSLQAAIDYAHRRGSMVVSQADECGVLTERNRPYCPDESIYGPNPAILPAALDHVVAVASVSGELTRREEASTGAWVDITAPGEGFYTTVSTDNLSNFRYISNRDPQPSDFAAAHVAGVAALVKSVDPLMGPAQIAAQLCNTARRDVGGPYEGVPQRNNRFGCGVLQAERAVEELAWRIQLPIPQEDPLPVPVADRPLLRHIVDLDHARPRVVVANRLLNERTWEIRQDVPWLDDDFVAQRPGQPSRLAMTVDMETLRGVNGELTAGERFSTLLRACPINDRNIFRDDEGDCRPYSPSGCFCFEYELVVAEDVSRIFLPRAAR